MKLILCNTPFDRENDNVLLFDSKAQLKNYFDNLSDKVVIPDINFNAQDLIETSVFVDIVENGVAILSLFKLLNYNYCIVEDDETTPIRYYYFIENSYQDNGNRVKLELKLDAWNTYIYDVMGPTQSLQGMIQKTHLDRFIKTVDDDYIYNFNKFSPLFERETIKDVSKRVSMQEKLKSIIDTTDNDSDLNDWLNENIQCWLYVYLAGNVEYSFLELGSTEPQNPVRTQGPIAPMIYRNKQQSTQNDIDSNFIVLCAPVYKTNNKLYVRCYNDAGTVYVDEQITIHTLFTFIAQQQGGFANVKSIKFSLMPPMAIKNYVSSETYTGDYVKSGNNLILHAINSTGDNTKDRGSYLREVVGNRPFTTDPLYNACFKVKEFDISQTLKMIIPNSMSIWKYTENEIKSQYVEPKLENEDYSTYRLLIGGQQYELPISKTSNEPKFIYREILTPDITKGILIFDTSSTPFDDKIFDEITEKDFTGFVFTIDLSMWFPNNALDNYLANNKNYLQIFKNDLTQSALKSVLGIGTSLFTYGLTATKNTNVGATSLGIGAVGVNEAINTAFDISKFGLTLDNMKNTPQETTSINSNAFLIQAVSGLNILIEKLEPINFEKQIIIDNLKMFGYNYNKIGNIYDYIKSRKYYNYIQAIIFDIDAKLSEKVKDIIKSNFSKGVRIWHADEITNVDFTVNNYERSIDNEQ